MKNLQPPANKKTSQQSKWDYVLNSNFLGDYIDITIRSLIMFGIAITISFGIKIIWKDLQSYQMFIILFSILILLSAIFQKQLNRIRVGRKIQKNYVNFLEKHL